MARPMILCLALLAVGVAACSGLRTTLYDTATIDAMIASKRLRESYIKCLLNTGRCDDTGTEMKESLPGVVAGKCAQCTPEQWANVHKINTFMDQNYHADWEQIKKMYS